MNLKQLTLGAALLATTVTAFADIKLDDHFTFSGYAAAAYMDYKPSGAPNVHGFFDASKPIPGGGDANDVLAKLTAAFKPVTLVASANYFPKISSHEFSRSASPRLLPRTP